MQGPTYSFRLARRAVSGAADGGDALANRRPPRPRPRPHRGVAAAWVLYPAPHRRRLCRAGAAVGVACAAAHRGSRGAPLPRAAAADGRRRPPSAGRARARAPPAPCGRGNDRGGGRPCAVRRPDGAPVGASGAPAAVPGRRAPCGGGGRGGHGGGGGGGGGRACAAVKTSGGVRGGGADGGFPCGRLEGGWRERCAAVVAACPAPAQRAAGSLSAPLAPRDTPLRVRLLLAASALSLPSILVRRTLFSGGPPDGARHGARLSPPPCGPAGVVPSGPHRTARGDARSPRPRWCCRSPPGAGSPPRGRPAVPRAPSAAAAAATADRDDSREYRPRRRPRQASATPVAMAADGAAVPPLRVAAATGCLLWGGGARRVGAAGYRRAARSTLRGVESRGGKKGGARPSTSAAPRV